MTVRKTAGKNARTYTKEQLLSAKRFAGREDALGAILKDGKKYTVEQTEKMLRDFMKRKVN